MSVDVVIVAAGRGSRMGGPCPKQFLPLGDGTVLDTTLQAFLSHPKVRRVVTVIHPDDQVLYHRSVGHSDPSRLLAPVLGGETRGASVRQGLTALADDPPDSVLIHDAARPFVSSSMIDDVIAAVRSGSGACAAIKVVDAIWDTAGPRPVSVPRDTLWRAQTPQGFDYDAICTAYAGSSDDAADDVAVAVAAGLDVCFVPGGEQNYKITTADDYERAQRDVAVAKT